MLSNIGSNSIELIKSPFRYIRDFGNDLKAIFLNNQRLSLEGYERIYHYHIRKTAGTSLNSAFWNLAGLDMISIGRNLYKFKDGYVFVLNSKRAIEGGNYFFANSHTPAHMLVLPPNTFTVTVLRSPVERVCSFYRYMRFAYEDESSRWTDPLWKEANREANEYFRDCSTSFRNFLQCVPHRNLSSQLYMFSSEFNSDEALENISNCSAVIFTEKFSEGIHALSKRLDLPLLPAQERRFSKNMSLDITGDEVEFLSDILEDEIKFYRQAQSLFGS